MHTCMHRAQLPRIERSHEICVGCMQTFDIVLSGAGDFLTSQVGGPDNLAKFRAGKQTLDPNNVFRRHPYIGLL